MVQLPSQQDIDSLAHFVQAATDLRTSPFFTDGQTTLGVTYTDELGGKRGPVAYRVPDPRVRDSLVVPFRRIWMTGELASFDRVANIIKRYSEDDRPYVDYFKEELKRTKTSFPDLKYLGLAGEVEPSISPEDTVDLWLNCRLAHVGCKSGVGRFSRADYEHQVASLGEALFEYLFMTAIFHIGLWYLNLSRLAQNTLKQWCDEGLQPTFGFDSITADGKYTTSAGAHLERHTPGMTIAEDDLEAKLKLLCLQRTHLQFSKLVELLHRPFSDLVRSIQESEDLCVFLATLGVRIDSEGKVVELRAARGFATVSDDLTDVSKYPWRKGSVTLVDGVTIFMEGDAYNILSEEYLLIRSALSTSASAGTHRSAAQ